MSSFPDQNESPTVQRNEVRILIVDDEPFICATISRFLKAEGMASSVAYSAEEALQQLDSEQFELMVSDIMMPGMSGIELLALVKLKYPDMAVVMATGVDSRETAIRALELGAYGYLIKPFDKNEIIINVANALERRRLTIESQEYGRRLEQEVRERTQDIRVREEEIALRLVTAAEYRDDETGQHIRRIGILSARLAMAVGWTAEDVDNIRLAASMHDVGKIGISDTILLKPGKLTKEEFDEIKKHSEIGGNLLGESDIPLLQLAAYIAYYHHEKWDGSGYPKGLSRELIPEAARIVAIVDVYDALVNDRVYRLAFTEEKALEIMKAGRGSHFDPRIFDIFINILSEFREIQAMYKE